jgi:DNA ligase 1
VKRLARALETAKGTRSRIAKEKALAGALSEIAQDPDGDEALATATRIATGRPLAKADGRSIGAGHSLWVEVASTMPGFSLADLRSEARKAGDLGEALFLLASNAQGRASSAETSDGASEGERPGLGLREVAQLFSSLADTGQRAKKVALLSAAIAKATPLEVKYLAKVLLGGMRTGMDEGVVQGAIARAFSAPLADVRRAMALVGDAGTAAVLAHRGRLGDAKLELGRPIAFMLATPIETLASEVPLEKFSLEFKIDGVRTQAHKRGDAVTLFARGMDDVTRAFPEIVRALARAPGDVALDGEVVALGSEGKLRPFQALQPRLKKLAPETSLLADAPVALFAFDLLADAEGSAIDAPWSERRARLERFFASLSKDPALVLHACRPATSAPVDRAFDEARSLGFEGLVLKRVDSLYEAGRRGQAWLKVKRAYATLDVVVTAAEEGHGRRAGVLSDYTFAVWKGDALVNVGKAYSGLTDEEIRGMTARLTALTLEERGGYRLVRPEIVLEVAFDGVQPSTRHASGFALRFPRIARIRDDKAPADADRLETVEALFAAQVKQGHREEIAAKPKKTRAKKAPRETRQLDLFGGTADKSEKT